MIPSRARRQFTYLARHCRVCTETWPPQTPCLALAAWAAVWRQCRRRIPESWEGSEAVPRCDGRGSRSSAAPVYNATALGGHCLYSMPWGRPWRRPKPGAMRAAAHWRDAQRSGCCGCGASGALWMGERRREESRRKKNSCVRRRPAMDHRGSTKTSGLTHLNERLALSAVRAHSLHLGTPALDRREKLHAHTTKPNPLAHLTCPPPHPCCGWASAPRDAPAWARRAPTPPGHAAESPGPTARPAVRPTWSIGCRRARLIPEREGAIAPT